MSAVLAIVGVVGLTTVIEVVRWLVHWSSAEAFLRLTYSGPVDVVLSPARSAEVPARAAGDRYALRMGNLRAASAVARAVGAISTRKSVRIHVSDNTPAPLRDDLVIIGSSSDNPLFTAFLAHVNRANPGLGLVFDERVGRRNFMGVRGRRWPYDWSREAAARSVERDVGLIVVWDNPFTPARRRAILCAGFTATGNAALVEHLFDQVAAERRLSDLLRRRRFAVVVDLRFLNGELDSIRSLCEPIELRPPRRSGARVAGEPSLPAGRRLRRRQADQADAHHDVRADARLVEDVALGDEAGARVEPRR